MNSPIIIIGSGLAGYMLAKEFRQLDKETPLKIITANEGRFYSKPLLSTALTAAKEADNLAISDAMTMAAQLNADIRSQTEVTYIDSKEHCIYIGQEKLSYSRLVLACGAENIKPPIIGNATAEILTVNDLESYTHFRKKIHGKKNIGILGAGLVGCEFANDLINAGYKVDLIAPANYPLESLLPEKIGLLLQETLMQSGVKWHLGQTALAIDHDPNGYAITLSSQRILQVDIVLSAIGLRSRTSLAEKALIKINRGIVVNQFLETSAENVYALGDCAEVNDLVLLFVAPLLNCARALAKTLSGKKTAVSYATMPIVLKTPNCPIVVFPPPRGMAGKWQYQGSDYNLKALYHDAEDQLRGFVLTGKAVQEKLILIKQITNPK